MSNDIPPRACLADFGFMTAVLDPDQLMACSAQAEGGMVTFMAPELLVPEMYGVVAAKPTPQADIYAFGLVIFQVFGQQHGYRLFLHIFLPGPYGRHPIPWCSAIRVGALCCSRRAPRQTGECFSNRIF